MQQIATHLKEIKLVGICARTNNVSEMNPITAKIGLTLQQYFQEEIFQKIQHRKSPGVTYCIYTEYESDFNGDYTYFVGEEVTSFDTQPETLTLLTIPSQHYSKFTSDKGVMPNVCINLWQKIWKMSPQDLGGTRNYLADFEIYDTRASDPQNVELDIYIGIKNPK